MLKSILLHVYGDTAFESRLQAALDIARTFDGHLTCLHATPFEDYLLTDPGVAVLPEEFSEKMTALRLELQSRVEERLRAEGANWDWVHRDEVMTTALIRYSILSDLIVVSLADTAYFRDEPRPVAAAVATGARAAVLAVPQSSMALDLQAPIVVAWNGSPEAAAALRAALPFLSRAPDVHVLEVEERPTSYPSDLAARYLARHGIEAEIVQRPAHGGISRAIMTAAEERGAGLIVMGAYGHSRLRELLLGGVTRDLLASSEMPLLLAH